MYPHRIRLHGPWQYEPLARTRITAEGRCETTSGSVPEPGRARIPTTWRGTPLDGLRGRVRWRRPFHAPRSLDPGERLWVVFDGVDYFSEPSLNGVQLGRHEGYFEPFGYDVTSLVQPRNQLVVDVDCPAESAGSRRLIRGSLETTRPPFIGGMWGEVALEVRATCCLRDVRVRTMPSGPGGAIAVTGQTVGDPNTPLRVELSLDGAWIAGEMIAASPEGADWALEARLPQVQPWWPWNLGEPRSYTARVDLHGNARTLDSATFRVGFGRIELDPVADSGRIHGRSIRFVRCEIEAGENPLDVSADEFERLRSRNDLDSQTTLLVRIAGRVVAPAVYELADSLGIVLQQDFPWTGGGSSDPAFPDQAARQARVMVQRLGHHPCIGLWSCPAESGSADRAVIQAIASAIEDADPTRPCALGVNWGPSP